MALLCGKQFVRCVWGNSPCPSAELSVVCAWCCLFVLHNSLYVLHALGEFALDEERNSSISSNFQPLMNRLLGSQLCTGHLCPVMFQFHLDVSLQRPPPPTMTTCSLHGSTAMLCGILIRLQAHGVHLLRMHVSRSHLKSAREVSLKGTHFTSLSLLRFQPISGTPHQHAGSLQHRWGGGGDTGSSQGGSG